MAFVPSVKKNQWPSLAALLIGNSVPLFGALFLHWDLFDTLTLFWLENWVVMFYTALRMTLVKSAEPWPLKFFMIPFFLVHFGLFTIGHGIFLVILTGANENIVEASLIHVFLAILGVFLSHGVSFVQYFLANGKWQKNTALGEIMARPYSRIWVMHLTVMLAAGSATFFPAGAGLAVILIALKTVADVWAHLSTHAKDAEQL